MSWSFPTDPRGIACELDAAGDVHLDRVAAVASGGSPDPELHALIDRHPCTPLPAQLRVADAVCLRRVVEVLNSLDGMAGVSEVLLRWVVPLAEPPRAADPWMHEAVVLLALRAAADAAGRDGLVQALHLVALRAAVRAEDAELRAMVLVQIADTFSVAGRLGLARQVLRLAEDDPRLSERMRLMLKELNERRAGFPGRFPSQGEGL